LKREDRQFLKEGARGFGVKLSERQLDLFALFLDRLWLWNRRVSLTGISEKRQMITRLLLEPLVVLPYLPSSGTVLDIGSGAGSPGLPLKIAKPEFEVHLLESKAKKVSFLKDIIRKLHLKGIEAYRGRAEKWTDPRTLFHFYDIVTARALAPLKETIGLCCPYLEPGSLLVTFKGSKVEQEIEDGHRLMEQLDLRISKRVSYHLPGREGSRYLLILKKEIY
jgi:16S rRNA (guanine527-N7)-methyltransferase